MSNMADSLPKPVNTTQSGSTWGSSSGNFNLNANKTANLGGPSIRSGVGVAASGSGIGTSNKDPFSSLAGFGSKQQSSLNSAAKPQKIDLEDDGFGDFQNASKPSSNAFPSSGGGSSGIDFDFSGSSATNKTPVQASSGGGGGDPMDMFFTSSSASSGGGSAAPAAAASSEIDDWGTEFGGGNHDVGGTTTELDGLPPPPAGISGSAAKSKGMELQTGAIC
jgi:hypothetical protein